MKAFKIHANKRRTLTPDEEADKAYMGSEFWPPWMETGYIRTCLQCGRRSWESVSDPDECPKCGVVNIRTDTPNWWERLVHWWLVDNRFTGKDYAKAVRAEQAKGEEDGEA